MKQLTLNLQGDLEATGEMTMLSLPVASHNYASHSALPENEKERKITDTSGRKCLEQFGKFSHVGSWAKMFTALLIGQEGWYSMRCRLTWKLRGTKYSRMYCQLVPSTRHTEETVFGLLPTVTAMDANGATANMKSTQVKEGSMNSMTLSRLILKTPTAADAYTGNLKKDNPKSGDSGTLAQEIMNGFAEKRGLLPTPQATDHPGKNTGTRNQNSIPKIIRESGGKTSQLNPRFVLEMMGFPPTWTELPFLSGETNQSKQPETP